MAGRQGNKGLIVRLNIPRYWGARHGTEDGTAAVLVALQARGKPVWLSCTQAGHSKKEEVRGTKNVDLRHTSTQDAELASATSPSAPILSQSSPSDGAVTHPKGWKVPYRALGDRVAVTLCFVCLGQRFGQSFVRT